MKEYETLHLVKGEDLNHHGTLFAARAAAWFVEAAFTAAACENGNTSEIVCRNVHGMSFSMPVEKGSILSMRSRVTYAGKTSLMVHVEAVDAMTKEKKVEGFVTFVTVDANSGGKLEHKIVLDDLGDENEKTQRAESLRIRSLEAKDAGSVIERNTSRDRDRVDGNGNIAVVNEDKEGILSGIECFALDMDGTIYLGEQWIEGAREFLDKIENLGKKYVFLTNNSSKNPDVYVEKLGRMGLKVSKDKIITSGQAAIYYLKKHYPGKKVFLLGNPMLSEEFKEEGILLEEENPEAVVTAFDTTLDYAKMCKVCDFVRAGLPYIATHPDYNCPTESGFIPDAGAIHAFIHASAGRYPDRVIGKPNGDIVDYLIERIGVERSKVAMVGDRLYTDIAAGKNNGLKSVLVLSGEATLKDVETSEVKPDLIFESVKEISLKMKKR